MIYKKKGPKDITKQEYVNRVRLALNPSVLDTDLHDKGIQRFFSFLS